MRVRIPSPAHMKQFFYNTSWYKVKEDKDFIYLINNITLELLRLEKNV